ncbi:MAG: PadR family transcriptional regulator [Coprococcus sp.]|nr:PadR family transcriptional regulator [Coprococcus sp.]
MAVDKSLVSGSTTMLVLRLLEEKDMYGYEMIETLRSRSDNVFELKAGTLYPLLHSMAEKEWIQVYEQEAGGKMRKYYHLTRGGKKQLAVKKAEWDTYASAVAGVMGGGVCYGPA